jgi:hypothetical protein
MAETFSTVQWDADVIEKSQQLATTRALVSTDIVRWRERVLKEAPGLVLESVGSAVGNLTVPKTMHTSRTEVRVPRVKRLSSVSKGNYILLKKYDGFITTRSRDTFTARLYERAGDYPVLEAEFDLEELSEADRNLAIEGAALVWTIGYHDEDSRKRESLI